MTAPLGSADRPHRVAIVGAGPSGFYAAEALLKVEDHDPCVDFYERLPAPFGLVRYGVAPDHQRIKNVTRLYARMLEDDRVRFFGNVNVGDAITTDDLLSWYDDVIITVGATTDRRLDIPGEDLSGSWSATEFVGWYNGDPTFQDRDFGLDRVRSAVVVGVGNVAVDVARVLTRDVDELEPTDITSESVETLRRSAVQEVHMLGRRGPAQARFSPSELKELAALEHVTTTFAPDTFAVDPVSEGWLAETDDRNAARNVDLMRELPAEPAEGDRVIRLRFLLSPVEILGDDQGRVRAVVVERNKLVASPGSRPRPVGTGEHETIECQAVFRSVGYRGVALPEVPFDDKRGVIPNDEGRVLGADGEQVPGLYTAGWIKRGPSGLIGTNKADAIETVQALLADGWDKEVARDDGWADRVDAAVRERVPDVFDKSSWGTLDELERARGEAAGKVREKFTSVAEMVELVGDDASEEESES